MNFKYICEGFSGMKPSEWIGEITPLLPFEPKEFEISARGSRFHLVLGKHSYGNYVYISNLGIGMDTAGLNRNGICRICWKSIRSFSWLTLSAL